MYSATRYRLGLLRFFSLGLCVTSANALAAPLVIDTFTTTQAAMSIQSPAIGTSQLASVSDAAILGKERDLILSLNSGAVPSTGVTTMVSGGSLSYVQDAATSGSVTCQWDGADNSEALAPTGLGEIDLTVGGTQDAFELVVSSQDRPIRLNWSVMSDANSGSDTALTLLSAITTPTSLVIPFSKFIAGAGGPANFAKVGAISLKAGTPSTAVNAVFDTLQTTATLTATMAVKLLTDADGNGKASPGDTLRYTVLITDREDAIQTGATNVDFTLGAGQDTTLIPGTVTTSAGTVNTGNGGTDKTIAVHTDTMDDGQELTIEFDTKVNATISAGVTKIISQGMIKSASLSIPTDDPDTVAAADATTIAVAAAPVIGVTMSDALGTDVNGDGVLNPGDSIVYTVKVNNTGNQSADALVFAAAIDSHTNLITDSVRTNAGKVVTGNAPNDTTVLVQLNTLAAGGVTTLTFEVQLPATAVRPESGVISAAGVLTFGESMLATDDPDTTAPLDPTRTEVVIPPVTNNPGVIPSLSGGGLGSGCSIGRATTAPEPLFVLLFLATGLVTVVRRRRLLLS